MLTSMKLCADRVRFRTEAFGMLAWNKSLSATLETASGRSSSCQLGSNVCSTWSVDPSGSLARSGRVTPSSAEVENVFGNTALVCKPRSGASARSGASGFVGANGMTASAPCTESFRARFVPLLELVDHSPSAFANPSPPVPTALVPFSNGTALSLDLVATICLLFGPVP
jgi:hypothetical protein